jgi:hypothetical protein
MKYEHDSVSTLDENAGTQSPTRNPTPAEGEVEMAHRAYEDASDRAIRWFFFGAGLGFAFACLVLR